MNLNTLRGRGLLERIRRRIEKIRNGKLKCTIAVGCNTYSIVNISFTFYMLYEQELNKVRFRNEIICLCEKCSRDNEPLPETEIN